jgi:hypothetical protein
MRNIFKRRKPKIIKAKLGDRLELYVAGGGVYHHVILTSISVDAGYMPFTEVKFTSYDQFMTKALIRD